MLRIPPSAIQNKFPVLIGGGAMGADAVYVLRAIARVHTFTYARFLRCHGMAESARGNPPIRLFDFLPSCILVTRPLAPKETEYLLPRACRREFAEEP